MKLWILLEAGKTYGWGHLTRCLGIYQALQEKGMNPHLMIHSDIKPHVEVPFELFNWTIGVQFLERFSKEDIVIIDSYCAPLEFYIKLAKKVKKLLVVDDVYRIDCPGAVTLNSAFYAKKEGYPCSREALLGPQYIPLRKEFWDIQIKEKDSLMSQVLFNPGSYVTAEETQNLAAFIRHVLKPEKLWVISRENVFTPHGAKNTEYLSQVNALEMSELLSKANLVVSAGGQTIYEALRYQQRIAAYPTAQNQVSTLQYLKDNQHIHLLGNEVDWQRQFEKELGRFPEVSLKTCTDIDGQGARRIVEFLLS